MQAPFAVSSQKPFCENRGKRFVRFSYGKTASYRVSPSTVALIRFQLFVRPRCRTVYTQRNGTSGCQLPWAQPVIDHWLSFFFKEISSRILL